MNERCELVKLQNISGSKASLYTVFVDDDTESLFDKFLKENSASHKSEILDLVSRLNIIGKETGAKYDFFKHKEGELGDGVCALYDIPDSNLRLYCIRYGNHLVILGGGGHKSKDISAFQENEKLKDENYLLRWLSKAITEKMKEKEIRLTENGLDFEGDLIIYRY